MDLNKVRQQVDKQLDGIIFVHDGSNFDVKDVNFEGDGLQVRPIATGLQLLDACNSLTLALQHLGQNH